MSLIHKIPPIVSALALGYGVGMAAPESTISSMGAAVSAYQQGAVPGRVPVVAASVVPAPAQHPVFESRPLTTESSELMKIREAALRDKGSGAACDLDRPSYSRPPTYASMPGRYGEDVDELDSAGAEALSRLQLPDLPLSITRRTLKYVRFFTRTDRGRDLYESWLKRSGGYQEMIQTALREWRLPEDLIWVAMIESGFDARARSPVGALGLWQFMPATGEVYGLEQNRYLDQRKNPRLATQAASHHLRDLYLRFSNWDLALAAYNMGYEQLLNAIDRHGTSDFNELARQEAIPAETAAYVPKIAAAAIVANNLERFGFDHVKVQRPTDAAEIAVPPRTALKTLAKAAGVATSAIRTLNPDILTDRLPPGRGDFLVLVPADTLARALAALPALLNTEPLQLDDASVLNPVDLLGGRDFDKRRAVREQESLLSLLPSPKKKRSMRDPVVSLLDNDDEPDPPRRLRKSRETVMYRVGPGDTLIGVARQFGLDIEDVAQDNGLDSDGMLRAGALLKLKVATSTLKQVTSDTEKGSDTAKGSDEEGAKSAPRDPAAKGTSSKQPEKATRDTETKRKKGRG